MEYIVYNGCLAIAVYKQKASAIRRAKKTALLNLIDETEAEITVVARRYSTDPNGTVIYSSYDED